MSYHTYSLSRRELTKYKDKFFETYIKPFDMHLVQLVDMRNRLYSQVKQLDRILHTSNSDVMRFDVFSNIYEVFGGSVEKPLDKWQEIFDEVIRKLYNNMIEFSNLDASFLDVHSFELDEKIIKSVKNS